MSKEKPVKIAIDGPSGAGKSTIAKRVAAELGYEYIDTGAMYRAVAYKMLKNKVGLDDTAALSALLDDTKIDLRQGVFFLDGEELGDQIRTPEVTQMASDASALQQVRQKLVALQRALGDRQNVVMDGRDIGTNVFRDAPYKFFLTASLDERARRRCVDFRDRGQIRDLQEVRREIEQRDYNDSHRVLDPLRPAEDAVMLDSTCMSIDQVTNYIVGFIRSDQT
ncbi:MAG TPA: (d)CMP kinase [Clostridiales bacterium]|jgi:cytidylate kinase|nr:(d)CMP kinase [Clostridiales bacterium]